MNATFAHAACLRKHLEDSLESRIPGALSPRLKAESERMASGIAGVDDLIQGGIPVGALTEFVGLECSGRTTVALTLLASITQRGAVGAWVDVDDVLDPAGAALSGVDLMRLLWVRCRRGEQSSKQNSLTAGSKHVGVATRNTGWSRVHAGGSPHPRSEGNAMPAAVQDLLWAQPRSGAIPSARRDKGIGTPGMPNRPLPRHSLEREEQVATDRLPPRRGEQLVHAVQPARRATAPFKPHPGDSGQWLHAGAAQSSTPMTRENEKRSRTRIWAPLDQALRATDLLLQAGGFHVIVLDLGSTPAEMSWRIPLATWFRFRAACARTQTSLVLLTKHPCARSSAELMVKMQPGRFETKGYVLTGIAYAAELERQRFAQAQSRVVPIRKPPQPDSTGRWKASSAWAI